MPQFHLAWLNVRDMVLFHPPHGFMPHWDRLRYCAFPLSILWTCSDDFLYRVSTICLFLRSEQRRVWTGHFILKTDSMLDAASVSDFLPGSICSVHFTLCCALEAHIHSYSYTHYCRRLIGAFLIIFGQQWSSVAQRKKIRLSVMHTPYLLVWCSL